MCGLAGFWSPNSHRPAEELVRISTAMADSLHHRGPDAGGVWVDESAGLGLGHRRLSIIDLSEHGAQPMPSADGRFHVAFNGEIYNYRELRAELLRAGHGFRGTSDTEVLLAAVAEWGLSGALERFRGMFAFALWDRQTRALHLARDRMGEKPLYYGYAGDTLLFGSELKALARHPEWNGEIDRDALTLYLRFNCVPAPFSIYRGIRKLPPAHFLSVPESSFSSPPIPEPYWSVAGAVAGGRHDPFTGTEEEAVEALDELLGDAVHQQMVADVPLGAFLSGGIDSSTVVALMQSRSSRPVQTFTIGFNEDAYNEAEYARKVAAHLGTDHTELYVTAADSLAVIPRLPTLYDEPFADSSQIPTFLVSQLARRKVTVSLSGDGGDELFGGYTRYRLAPRIWKGVGWIPYPIRSAVADSLVAIGGGTLKAVERIGPNRGPTGGLDARLQKLRELLLSRGREDVYVALVSSWRDPETGTTGGREVDVPATAPDPRADSLSFIEAMMYRDALGYLPDDILVKVDRAAMGVSLETRAPMLDHRVVEFAWRLPLEMKYGGGRGKRVLRGVLDRYVPRHLIERPKMGFGLPVSGWLRGPLREWAEELLDERRLKAEGYLEVEPVRRRWRQHLAGTHDWQFALWGVLMFQAWLEETKRGAPSDESSLDLPALSGSRSR